MLTTSLLMGRHPPVTKTFAVHLDELPITGDGIPHIVVRMALFIEKYGKYTIKVSVLNLYSLYFCTDIWIYKVLILNNTYW